MSDLDLRQLFRQMVAVPGGEASAVRGKARSSAKRFNHKFVILIRSDLLAARAAISAGSRKPRESSARFHDSEACIGE